MAIHFSPKQSYPHIQHRYARTSTYNTILPQRANACLESRDCIAPACIRHWQIVSETNYQVTPSRTPEAVIKLIRSRDAGHRMWRCRVKMGENTRNKMHRYILFKGEFLHEICKCYVYFPFALKR